MIKPKQVIVVVGYKKEMVIKYFKSKDMIFVEQKKQQGTADAIKQCFPNIENFNGNVLILSGDVPMITYKSLKKLIDIHNSNNASASLISAKLNDPTWVWKNY